MIVGMQLIEAAKKGDLTTVTRLIVEDKVRVDCMDLVSATRVSVV